MNIRWLFSVLVMKEIIFQPLKEENVSAIVALANHELGTHYLCEETLKNYLQLDNTYCIQAVLNKETVGFSVVRVLPKKEFIMQYAVNHKNLFEDLLKNSNTILYRAHTVVSKEFQKKGIANLLVKFTQEQYEPLVDTALSVAWVKNRQCSMEHVLVKYGFHLHTELKKYWKEDSLQKKYYCAACKKISCECNAKVFVKRLW